MERPNTTSSIKYFSKEEKENRFYRKGNYKKNLTIGCLMWIVIFIIAYSLFSCSSDDKPNCNCNAIYRNVWTQEQKSYPNEEINCETKEPIEPVKEETWYFVECKNNPTY